MIYYKVLVISPGHFIKLNIRKYRLQWQRYSKKKKKPMKCLLAWQLRIAITFFFFQIPLLKLLPKKKNVYHQLMVILTFLLMNVSKQLSLINSKAGC